MKSCILVSTLLVLSACSTQFDTVSPSELAVEGDGDEEPNQSTTTVATLGGTSAPELAIQNISVSGTSDPFREEILETARKASLPSPELLITPEVEREIARFVKRDRKFITGSLREREKYYPQILSIFREHGIPEELVNVGIIESQFQTDAGSPKGAVGIWQFMKATAAQYGLRVGRKADERKDPILSTMAAAQHLRDLYDQLGDWFLALAAYNAGLGRISRALASTGYYDFWKLARSGVLNRQTADYVPRFIAVTLIVNNLEKYGFTDEEIARASNIG
jgi:hypothetical protein